MGTAYHSREDAVRRLNRTICTYKGVPFLVSTDQFGEQFEEFQIGLYPLGKQMKNPKLIDYRDDDFDYKSVPLGYITYRGDAHYLTRVPDRKNRQGICETIIQANPEIVRGGWFNSKEMHDCITGRHRSLTEALALLDLDGEHSGISIHRHIALAKLDSRNVGLYYRSRLIGFRKDNGNLFTLLHGKDTSFLKKILELVGIRE